MNSSARHVVVVGGGPAGSAAAIEVARLGCRVTLVDEHPQSAAAMSLDAPYFYGARFSPLLSNVRAVAERVLGANEALMACVEAGVEVLTSTVAWGVFLEGPTSRHLGAPKVALADDQRSWCLDFDALILAPGARDLVLSFPGWQLPGVLGVKGASTLLESYHAFEGRRVLILGSGTAGLAFARSARASGINVAGVVDPAGEIAGDAALAQALQLAGVTFLLDHAIERAIGTQEVEAARLVHRKNGSRQDIACDTIVMAFGPVPNVELAAIAGCALTYDEMRGGWCPVLGPDMQSSVEGVFVVGDGAGIDAVGLLDPEIAIREARAAARAAACGETAPCVPPRIAPVTSDRRGAAEVWLEALVDAAGLDVVVCQCEEVTRRELLDLAPPRYLGTRGRPPGEALETAIAGGRLSQDLVKRMTRAGMGHCQGKRCRDHVAMLLARALGLPLANVAPGTYRAPVRPVSLAVMQADDESAELRERWAYWLHPVEGPPAGL